MRSGAELSCGGLCGGLKVRGALDRSDESTQETASAETTTATKVGLAMSFDGGATTTEPPTCPMFWQQSSAPPTVAHS